MLLSCAAGVKGLVEPENENSVLIIGSAFLENNYYNEQFELYKDAIEVAVMGQIEENDETKVTGLWAETDENGYFCISNVPPGRYIIKGIRVILSTGELLTITNPRDLESSNFILQMPDRDMIIFDGSYFGEENFGQVVNLGINQFTIDKATGRSRRVHNSAAVTMENVKSPSGDIINFINATDYFAEQYPQSGWVQYLTKTE